MASDLLASPFSPEECLRRIRAAADVEGSFGSRAVIGWVGKDSATIRKRIPYRNSFQTSMRIGFEASAAQGALLVCRSGMAYFTQIFSAIWFGFLVLIAAAMTLMTVAGRMQFETSPAVAVGAPWLMVALAVGLVTLGRRMARGEREFLLHFLAETIEARPR